MTMRPVRAATVAAVTLAATLGLGGCGSSSTGAGDGGTTGRPRVVAAFYALQFAAEQVAGDHASVTGLTRPGAEPHDLELTPKEVASMSDATLIVHLGGFQPAVDDAVRALGGDAGFDVSPAARLDVLAAPDGEPGSATGTKDPHFWLDADRYAAVGTAIGEQLAARDAPNATAYRARAKAFAGRLHALDGELRAGLRQCRSRELVTAHTAFGYLAARYGLTQRGIAGLSPDAEPDAATMRTIAEHVRTARVTTIYAETLVSPALAQTIARETGARVAVLDPVEGITPASAGRDYFAVMRADLATLRAGQGCS